MKELSSRYQILCVTHLAQIAAFADHQYRIEKLVWMDGPSLESSALNGDARVEELVRMMSGSRVDRCGHGHVKDLGQLGSLANLR